MKNRRAHLLSILGIGFVFAGISVPALFGRPSLPQILFAVAGVGMVLSSVYELLFTDEPAGPASPN